VGVSITEQADCLQAIGQLDRAADAYQEAIKRGEQRNDKRSNAVNNAQLGTVRLLQRRYAEALAVYEEARQIFEGLGEPESVATAWHMIGIVHRKAGNFAAAERAYRQALVIEVGSGDRRGQASTLDELGTLYQQWKRLEEAVVFHQQAAGIRFEIKDLNAEGRSRSNMAIALRELRRYDEARRELLRAIECNQPFGHAALPWTTWNILHNLEQAAGNASAAAEARQKAVEAYLAYRRDGGENQNPGAQLCELVFQAIQKGEIQTAQQYLVTTFSGPGTQDWAKAMVPKLHAILQGSRDPSLAEDPALDFDDTVELRLLLEKLGGGGPAGA
jgi:tetratricopeptide (TPR) repeat protein